MAKTESLPAPIIDDVEIDDHQHMRGPEMACVGPEGCGSVTVTRFCVAGPWVVGLACDCCGAVLVEDAA